MAGNPTSRRSRFRLQVPSFLRLRSRSAKRQPSSVVATVPLLESAAPKSPSLPPASPRPPTAHSELPPPSRDLWKEAVENASEKAKKWAAANGYGGPESQSAKDSIHDLLALAEEKEAHCKDHPWAVSIGTQKIIFRDYVADFVRFLTTVGDAVVPFAPQGASAPWGVVKAVMKVSCVDSGLFLLFIFLLQ